MSWADANRTASGVALSERTSRNDAHDLQSGFAGSSLRNDAHNCLPFSTMRLASNREVASRVATAHKEARNKGVKAHPDHDWIHERFAWQSKDFGEPGLMIEPTAVWGSHASEQFLACWARELGIASCKAIRLAPEVVCVAAMEQSKLRAAINHVISN